MSERAEALATELDQVRGAVIAFVEQCPAASWYAVTRDEGWSVCAVCRHIARGFAVHPQLIQQAAADRPMPVGYTWEIVHESNAQQAQAWAALSREEVRAALRRDSDEALRVVHQLGDDDLDRTVLSPLDGVPVSVHEMVEAMIAHPRAHLRSVKDTIQQIANNADLTLAADCYR